MINKKKMLLPVRLGSFWTHSEFTSTIIKFRQKNPTVDILVFASH